MCLLNRLQCSWAICGYCKDWQPERALWSDLARFGLYALVLRKKQDSLDESAKSGRKQSKLRNHKRISLVYCATVLAFFLKWKEGYTRKLCVTFEYRKKWKKKVKKKKNLKRQVPRNRISILTGTAFAVQCSTHWAAGNLPRADSKF